MDVAKTLLDARSSAGLSQRELAARAGMPQSTVARIERGQLMPRVDTFDRLLRASGTKVTIEPLTKSGVDISLIRDRVRMTPGQRARLATQEAKAMVRLVPRQKPA